MGDPAFHQAIPILNDALAALDTIKEADINYIKKLANPPGAIKLVMEAVCVVLDVKPAKVGGRGNRVGTAAPEWYVNGIVVVEEGWNACINTCCQLSCTALHDWSEGLSMQRITMQLPVRPCGRWRQCWPLP